ncbi:MAG: hypothetical protein ACFFDT_35840 [Candidatus Hodarchaeota archaeon]
MTSLDTIISTMKAKCDFIAAVQNTPQDILLVVTSENFWRGLKILDQHNIRLRFLEKRERSLDVHFSVTIRGVLFQVTFRIADYSSLI